MSTSKLFGKDIFITSTTEASANSVGTLATLGGINVTKTVLTAGGVNSTSNTNTLGNLFTTGGNIGIGTTAPTQTLSVAGNFNFTGSLFQNGSVYSGSTQWGSTGANIYFNTGRVGLGTLSPSSLLSLNGTSGSTANGPHIHISVDNSVYPIYQQLNWVTNNIAQTFDGYWDGAWRTSSSTPAFQIYKISNQLQFNYANGSAGSVSAYNTAMILDSRGNIGIGTTSPSERLHIFDSSDCYIRINANAGNKSGIKMLGGSMGVSSIYQDDLTTDLKFDYDSTNLMTIEPTGNVGIGTTAPNAKLDVNYSGITQNQNVLSLHGSNTATTDYNLIEAGHGSGTSFVVKGNSNVGIGTTAPAHKLDVVGTIDATTYTGSNIMISGSIGSLGSIDAGSQFLGQANDTISAPSFSWTGDTNTGIYRPLTDQLGFVTNGVERMRVSSAGNVGIGTTAPQTNLHINNGGLQLGAGNTTGFHFLAQNGGLNAYSGTWGTGTTRFCCDSRGNFGIGTLSPTFTLDVNGTIARNGVRLPRFDNGSFSGSSSFSIPILFNDTNYNYCEIKVRYVVSSACNINISATNYVNVAMGFNECALTTVRWNAQGTPVYTTFSSVTSGLFANDVEQVGLDNNLIFRIVRATGTSTSGIRNQYSYDNVYCWSGTGTARGYGQGHIDNTSLGGSPLQFITFTCSTGTVSGTYSTVHSY